MSKSDLRGLNFYIRMSLFIILSVWCLGIFYEFFMGGGKYFLFAYPFVKMSYSLVCHQQANKLIEFGGHHTMVCARCTGIYIGALLSAAVSLFVVFKRQPKIKYLLFAMIPMLVDVVIHSFDILPYNKTEVFLTGLLLGSAGFVYFYAGLKKIINKEE